MSPRIQRLLVMVLGAIALGVGSCGRPQDEPGRIVVFAAASTTDVMREAALRFGVRTGIDVVLNLGSSSTLARQIEAGAPADVFLSANQQWMDHLEAAGRLRPESRVDLLSNDLVLVAPAGKGVGKGLVVEPSAGFDFAARLPGVERVAVGDPTHVPAGQYARQALESLGWEASGTPDPAPIL